MFYVLLLVAIVIVIFEVLASRKNRSTKQNNTASSAWQNIYRWRWVVGVPFAIVSAFVYFPMSGETESYRVMGFPLMVAAFDEAGRDYVGPFTGPSFIANAVIWYFLPHIILMVWAYLKPGSVNKSA